MRVLSVGNLENQGVSNTCLQRHHALCKVASVVDVVNTSPVHCSMRFRVDYHLFLYGLPVRLPDETGANRKMVEMADKNDYDIVWIDKGVTISPETLRSIKQRLPKAIIVSYSPDNMALRHNQSQQYVEGVPLYDFVITNKSYIVDSMRKMGARHVIVVDNTFEPSFHHPYHLSEKEKERLGGAVGFIGMWEKERCEAVMALARHGIPVRIWGGGRWNHYRNALPNLKIEGRGLFSDDYCKALSAFSINLCFLRKMNFDRQTTRSVEIPACGGFMLAERTAEHLHLFAEDKEAVYFSSLEELEQKCKYYLFHPEKRESIARAGYERCLRSDYSNEGMIRRVFHEMGVL